MKQELLTLHSQFFGGVVLLIFLAFCVGPLYVCMFRVPCCDVCYNFRKKNDVLFFALSLCTLCCQFLWIVFLFFALSLCTLCCQFLWIVFVLFFALSLCTLCCQFLWIVCFVFRLKLVYPMLPVSLDRLYCFSP